MQTTPENVFSKLSEDVVLKIFFNLEDDPRHWARLACVCTKFCSLMHTVCWITKCSQTIPTLVSDLLSTSASSTAPPGGWASLHKLAVCCPGLLHAGVLEHELGPKKNGQDSNFVQLGETKDLVSCDPTKIEDNCGNSNVSAFGSLYDDFCNGATEDKQPKITEVPPEEGDFPVCKRRKVCRSVRSHLASGVWNLSREQGNKLLASRFRGDCLYISDWPGCLHVEEKRNYMLFRGVFKNFKRSKVWRTISDGNRSKIDLNCAFCSCKQTWDLHSAFCLRQVFGYHDDGEQVVRAYVCENGHVSGAWTDWPLYT